MIQNLNLIVGQRISEILKNEKQDNMANKLNVLQGTVSKWKTGKQIPNPETLVMIAELYDVSLDWLLGLSDVKERNSLALDRISYAQVIFVLDRLFNLANIEVLNFHEAAKEKKLSVGYISEKDESLKNDTDYIKINDRVLSYLLRRRRVIYDYDDELDFVEHRTVDIDAESKHQGSKVLKACEDCDVLIAVEYGFKSKIKAEDLGIKLVRDEGPVDEVLQRYINHYNFMKN